MINNTISRVETPTGQLVPMPPSPILPSINTGGSTGDKTPPTLTVHNINKQFIIGKDTVDLKSTEVGFVYLVPSSENPTSWSDLESLAYAGFANKATVSKANHDVSISTRGLSAGTFKVYVVDVAGNVSKPITVTLSGQNPQTETVAKKAERLATALTDEALGLQNGEPKSAIETTPQLVTTAGEASTIVWTSNNAAITIDSENILTLVVQTKAMVCATIFL
ncbi:hypothetical protein [Ureibacillus endophyticus]|uniref:Uncharacterized protein n=1 Tax=Ureibacillus endophyticus TaxID=1978490 RepID=A0A494YSM4_9BACL|nr:hypothetical protein [Lysinibacillus endophyticus]RKQ13125.1 hypothetical protein D8M03_16610 [Lysinibacillus endophyticus]